MKIKMKARHAGLAALSSVAVLLMGCMNDDTTLYDPYTPTNYSTTRTSGSAHSKNVVETTTVVRHQAPVATSVSSTDPAEPAVMVTQPGTPTPVPPPMEEPVIQ